MKVNATTESPTVKDPFTASKRLKKTESTASASAVDDENEVEILEEIEAKKEEKKTTNLKSDDGSKANDKTPTKITVTKSKKSTKSDGSEENDEAGGEEKESKSAASTIVKYDKEEFKKASNGQEWNLKIVSWNMNGIRAWLEVSYLSVFNSYYISIVIIFLKFKSTEELITLRRKIQIYSVAKKPNVTRVKYPRKLVYQTITPTGCPVTLRATQASV